LLRAIQVEQVDIVRLLLSRGANVNDMDYNGHIVINMGYNQEIKTIIEKWPASMLILVLNELKIIGCLDYDDISWIHEEVRVGALPQIVE
jgi:hypothetical protein